MDKLQITGGRPLRGEITASGSKNSALPIMAATLLAAEPVRLRNVPTLRDVTTMAELLRSLGAEVTGPDAGEVTICRSNLKSLVAPYDLVKTMRASFLVLGPLVARYGRCSVSLPGGCAIGTRPVDQHLMALERLGAEVRLDDGYVHASAASRLRGARITMEMVTVGGTQNALMAAVLADGETVIENAAKEPEVVELACFLRALGAQIEGDGTDKITVDGVERLGGCTFDVQSDRIEVGTYLIAAAATGGAITIHQARPRALGSVLAKLAGTGVSLSIDGESISLDATRVRPQAVDIATDVYPGIPTDLQAQFMVLNCLAEGESTVTETVFENRFMHVQELVRLGADIVVEDATTVRINGVEQLSGAPVMATDLRASSCLVIGGMAAEGVTQVDRIYHIDRGYEHIEDKLRALNAEVERVS